MRTDASGIADGAQRVGRVRLLGDERAVKTLSVEGLHVTLTDRRVLVNGEEKRLLFFPGASTSRAALIADVSVAYAGSRFLPDWLALLGVGLTLVALFQGLRENMIWLAVGLAAIAAWCDVISGSRSPGFVAGTSTNPDGTWSFALPLGTYKARLSPTGLNSPYEIQWWRGHGPGTQADCLAADLIVATADVAHIDFALRRR